MSMKAVTLVEERSRAKGSNLAALRSIADFANDRGQGAFPSPSTIAWKNRLTVRAAELIVRKLVEDGEVQPEWDAASRRLYLHVRCICDWEAYQAEGPIPLREIFSRSVRSDFAERLVELAKNRATEVSSHDSTTEKSCTTTEEFCSLSEKSCVENDASASSDGTSRSYPSDPLNDPSTDPVREGSATPSQLAPAAEPAPATEPPSATKPEIPLESSTAITRIDLEGFQADWNAEAQRSHLPRCTELTKRRRRLMRAALTERSRAVWREVFARVSASDYLAGRTDRRAPVTLDWLIADATHAAQVLEGHYDNRRPPARRGLTIVAPPAPKRPLDLPTHITRVLQRLRTSVDLAAGNASFLIELEYVRVRFLNAVNAEPDNRPRLLAQLDTDMLWCARKALSAPERSALEAAVTDELAAYRQNMQPDAYAKARDAAMDRVVRDRFKLPILIWDESPKAVAS